MRNVLVFALVMVVCISLLLSVMRVQPNSTKQTTANNHPVSESYILVGGQNGTWFASGQAPRLYKLSLSDYSIKPLLPVTSQGTVWTGGWNGSQWLISGWGTDPGPRGSNPYIYLYDGQNQIVAGALDQSQSESSWKGGDIFAASYNGKEWLLSGLGSGVLTSYEMEATNHMSLATFDGYNFTDLSSDIPTYQWDAILYANAWNGNYWLVGGGYEGNEGVLFRYNGTSYTDLSSQLDSVIPQFDSVQAIGWNGEYWLVGGVGFLVKYDGQNFTDLTPELDNAINSRNALHYTECCNSVNALKWNGISWIIGGGAPVAVTEPLTAWIVVYNHGTFTDLSSLLPTYVTNPAQNSSILSVTYTDESWFIGGYANDHGMLLSYANSAITDISYLVDDSMSTVNWVGGAEAPGQSNINASSYQATVNLSKITIPFPEGAFLFCRGNSISMIIVETSRRVLEDLGCLKVDCKYLLRTACYGVFITKRSDKNND